MMWVKKFFGVEFYKAHRPQIIILIFLFLVVSIIEAIFYVKFQNEFGRLGYTKKHLAIGRVQDSPYTVYEPVPNTINLKAKFRQNNYGLRCESDVAPKRENEFRIFILGGSGAIGQGAMQQFVRISGQGEYPSEFTIAAYLEEKLTKIHSEKEIKVFNAAVSGFTISLQYNFYMGTIRKLNPDLIILIDGYNDIFFPLDDPDYYRNDVDRKAWEFHPYKKNFIYRNGMKLMSKSYTFFYLGKKIFASKFKYDEKFYKKWLNEEKVVDYDSLNVLFSRHEKNISKALDDILKRYEIFKNTCRLDSVEILFCPQPILTLKPKKNDTEKACYNYLLHWKNAPLNQLPYFGLYEYYLKCFEEWAEEQNAAFVILQNEVNKTDDQIFIDYCHLTLTGNEFISQILEEKIVQMDVIKH